MSHFVTIIILYFNSVKRCGTKFISFLSKKQNNCRFLLQITLYKFYLWSKFWSKKGEKIMPKTSKNLYKRKDGRWEGRYIKCHSLDGKVQYGSVYGKSYKEAKDKLLAAELEIKEKSLESNSTKKDILFSDLINDWFEQSKPFLKESTLVRYQNLIQSYILPQLGDCNISEITNDKISKFSNFLLTMGGKKKTGLSSKTVLDVLSLLRSVQRYAESKDYDIRYVSHGVLIKKTTKPLHVFSIQEQQSLYAYLKANESLSNMGILLCLFTGLRVGELCALKWGDISLLDRTIYVHQTMQRIQTKENGEKKTKILISTPKSNCSIRVIPLPDSLVSELSKIQQRSDAFFLSGNSVDIIEPRTMQNRFKKVLNACGIENANFHTLRHTFATRCIEVGFDVKSLSEILGHANVNITLNRYVHPSMNLKRQNMCKLDTIMVK